MDESTESPAEKEEFPAEEEEQFDKSLCIPDPAIGVSVPSPFFLGILIQQARSDRESVTALPPWFTIAGFVSLPDAQRFMKHVVARDNYDFAPTRRRIDRRYRIIDVFTGEIIPTVFEG